MASPVTTCPPARRPALPDAAVRIGFVPLVDAAPLLVARDLGHFAAHGLHVRLTRELGWASIRAKLAYGELDASHAPAALPLALSHGVDGPAADCLTALVLNLNGNAITLSRRLADQGASDPASLADLVRGSRRDPLVFGVVSHHSSHPFLLRRWLASGGLEPGRDVRMVVVPPPQLWANLRAGHLDGFCAGDPWNTAAILGGDGVCVATSHDLAPSHPEKVLAVRGAWAGAHPDAHLRLVAALREACAVCDDPVRRDEVVAVLARPDALNVPQHLLRPALEGPFRTTRNTSRKVPDFVVFSRHDANAPTTAKAQWVAANLLPGRLPAPVTPALLGRAFRMDLFEAACRLGPTPETKSIPNRETESHPVAA